MRQAVRIYGEAAGRLRCETAGRSGILPSSVRLRDWWVARGAQSVIWFEIYLLSFFGILRDLVGLPGMITYLFDAINIALFAAIIVRDKHDNKSRYYPFAVGWILLYLFTTLIGGLIAGDRMVLYLWGFRNFFRFYIFFACCVTLLGARDIPRIVLFFKRLFFVNMALCLLEYAMGYSGDFIGGSFGTSQGGNGYLNILLIIALALYVDEYLAYRTSLLTLAAVLLLCCLVIGIAELKVFFVELPIVVFLAVLLERPTVRSMTILVVMVLGVAVGLFAMSYFFSEYGLDFFTGDGIVKYMGDRGYTNTGDLSRMNAVKRVTNMFFVRNPIRFLFGFGLGNCSYSSSFAMLTSSFYDHFSRLHYTWLTDAYVYLETGLIGLVIYELFFVLVFFVSRLKRYRNPDLRAAVNCAGILALTATFLSVYNSSMTVESGYMAYLFFAVPFILDKYRRPGTVYAKDMTDRDIVEGGSVQALRSGED